MWTAVERTLESVEVFHVRSIFPDQQRVASSGFDLQPTNPQGEAVCSLFERFLVNRPPSFRDKLGFLRKGDFEIDWSSAPGGVALATIFEAQEPATIAVLLSGRDPDTDSMMREVFRENVLQPLFGSAYDEVLREEDRPLIVEVILPGRPEWVPALQLLSASLGSVYFRSMLEVGEGGSDPRGCCEP